MVAKITNDIAKNGFAARNPFLGWAPTRDRISIISEYTIYQTIVAAARSMQGRTLKARVQLLDNFRNERHERHLHAAIIISSCLEPVDVQKTAIG